MAGYCHRLAFLVDFEMIIATQRVPRGGCEVSRRNEWPNVRDLFHFPSRTRHPSTRGIHLWRVAARVRGWLPRRKKKREKKKGKERVERGGEREDVVGITRY